MEWTITNKPYAIDGIAVRDNGARVPWTGWQIESARDIYTVRAYRDGPTLYLHNYQPLSSLPNTPLVRRLLDHVQETGFTWR